MKHRSDAQKRADRYLREETCDYRHVKCERYSKNEKVSEYFHRKPDYSTVRHRKEG